MESVKHLHAPVLQMWPLATSIGSFGIEVQIGCCRKLSHTALQTARH